MPAPQKPSSHPHGQRDHPQLVHQHKAVSSLTSTQQREGARSQQPQPRHWMEPGSAAPALQWVLTMLLCRAQLCSHGAASPCARTDLARPRMATSAPCSALPAARAERAAGIWLPLLGKVPIRPWDGPGHPPAPFPAQAGIAGVWERKARSSPGNRVPGSTWGLTPASALCLRDHAR